MHHATNRVKGFYAKTKKPARPNMPLPTTHYSLPTFNKQLSAFSAHATFSYLPCPGGGMADAEDLKSSGDFSSCGFDSHPGHQSFLLKMNELLVRSFPCTSGVPHFPRERADRGSKR